ncbi:MAG: DegT/DnrJ/EryC1/StrS family aminotransferase [Muribaculaceae bacterium]|nr:DegT/DnrJ/EryC1/StrS family aminotransferase [Muribaculaceae bacterium]
MSEKKKVLLCLNHLGGREIDFVLKAFADNWLVPLGPDVEAFESALESFIGGDRKAVALCSGTAAMHIALDCCGVGPDDEVMVPTFTFCASVNPVVYLGATPVFVDSEPSTWNMDPALLDAAIDARVRATGRLPKAIIVVDLYGMPASLDAVAAVAAKWEVPLIEDAAEAFGSSYGGRRCGSFGRFGVLSFNGNKMITTSGGGALMCADSELAWRAMYLATQARQGYAYYQHDEIGYNYRLSNISAAIGRGQMLVADEHISHHRHVHALYRELLSGTEGVTLLDNPSAEYDSNFWLCNILLDSRVRVRGRERAYTVGVQGAVGGAAATTADARSVHTDCEPSADVEALRLRLAEEGIESRPLWKPLHRQPVFAGAPAFINGVAEELFTNGLCLPAGPWVSDGDVRRITDIITASLR